MAVTITIITVVKNDELNIGKTIESVLGQDYPSLEYIVVDGGSSDQTNSIIQKYTSKITRIISEPDMNLYDAMNKGVAVATGKWINFMNSGDRFVDNYSISNIFTSGRDEYDLIYGNTVIELQNGSTHLLKVKNKRTFWKRYINQQSIFIKTELLSQRPFNLKYDLCSDFDLLVHLYLQKRNILALVSAFSIRRSGGRSDKHRVSAQIQKWIILTNYYKSISDLIHISMFIFIMIIVDSLKSAAKIILPGWR